MNQDQGSRLLALADTMLSAREVALLLELLDRVLVRTDQGAADLGILGLVQNGGHSTAFNCVALHVNRLAREFTLTESAATRAPLMRSLLHLRERLSARVSVSGVSGDGDVPAPMSGGMVEDSLTIEDAIARVYQTTVGRSPAPAEIDIWKNNFENGLPFHEFLLLMGRSSEASQCAQTMTVLGDLGDGECIQIAYEVIMGRGAGAWEIEHWLERLENGGATRAEMLASLFDTAARFFSTNADMAVHDGLTCMIMGTGRLLSAADWQSQAQEMRNEERPAKDTRYGNRFYIKSQPKVLVSALASLYRGGDFIEQFMDNITSQSCFGDYCELIIVDADSPDNEYATIARYLARHRNINYIRCNYRIGIYDAWNVAAKAARGEFLTNTNMDDLRRHDSLEIQAATLESLPFVDVVYQDLYYTFDARLAFDEIAAFGHETALPVITAHNMMKFNSPHNAPMWRAKLHEDVGYFDTRYKSAGDYEFWMRCLAAGKKFYKINDPHVVYYQNPQGLSTRPDTRGVREAMQVNKEYCRKLIPEDVIMSRDAFLGKLAGTKPRLESVAVKDRYTLTQQALRNLARVEKFSGIQTHRE